MKFNQSIDFDKYHTFFLEYWMDTEQNYCSHIVRPCTATYEEITDTTKFRRITLEAAVIAFDKSTSLSEVLIECALHGIPVDFVDFYVETEEHKTNRWHSPESKIIKNIDTHKEDIKDYLDVASAPKYYIAANIRKRDTLKYLVVNRFLQSAEIKFLIGDYSKEAVVAGFKSQDEAVKYCNDLNKTNDQ